MTTPEQPETRRAFLSRLRGGWLSAILVVSLAFNLFVIGAVAAHHIWDRRHAHHVGRISGPGFTQLLPRRFFAELADGRRDELRTLIRQHRHEFSQGRTRLRQTARAVADALGAEPFDQAKLDQALQAFAKTGHSLIDMGASVAQDVISRLTPAERKKLAEQLVLRSRTGSRSRAKKHSQ